MTDPATGLPADNMTGPVARRCAREFTCPTNIGGYLWSTVAARDLGVISRPRRTGGSSQTLGTLATMDRHDPSGMFYNWYDPHTGAKLHDLARRRQRRHPFLSSVDNGWLAAALHGGRAGGAAAGAGGQRLLATDELRLLLRPDRPRTRSARA